MKNHLTIAEQLKLKYHKTVEVTNFKDMLYRSSENFKSRTAFKEKDEQGNIITITYETFKNDVVYLGTDLIKRGFYGHGDRGEHPEVQQAVREHFQAGGARRDRPEGRGGGNDHCDDRRRERAA